MHFCRIESYYFYFRLFRNTYKIVITLSTEKKVRFYPNLVKSVIQAMQEIFSGGKQSDYVVRKLLQQNKKWGSRDRRFVSSTIYDMVRWYRFLYEGLGHAPASASDWWQMFAILQVWRGVDLPDWEEFKEVDKEAVKKKLDKAGENPVVAASFPDWMAAYGLQAYGAAWSDIMQELNKSASFVIRVNTLKTTKALMKKALDKEGVIVEDLGNDALLVPKKRKLTHLDIFRKGWFEIQDYSSQQVAPMLDVHPGMTVIDACAGAGGKALHLAALMGNKGKIIAMDISKRKLEELEKRARRAGIDIIETHLIHPAEDFSAFEGVADRLLLDVPCSGSGTIRRSPDIKWKLTANHIEKHRELQSNILKNYPAMLKPDGSMVYATCSIFLEENTQQVHQFLAKANPFSLVREQQILSKEGHDGFYMANMVKNA